MTLLTATRIVLIATGPLIILYDLIAYWYGGNDATISKQLLLAAQANPLLTVMVSFCVGVLMGHLFVPQAIIKP